MFHWRVFLAVMIVGMLTCACGGIEDREGSPLKVGERYLMTPKGLEHVPFQRDCLGNRLEVGKTYKMTGNGLEPVTHLRDAAGRNVEVGNDYFMSPEGLRPVLSRSVQGILVDAAGKPLSGLAISIEGSSVRAVSEGTGAFRLPFIEGSMKLILDTPDVPVWCRVVKIAEGYLRREEYPAGWDLGPVPIPCAVTEAGGGKRVWTTPDGRFTDNGDGTLLDLKNRLMWESEVQTVESLDQARAYTEALKLAGHEDWRLPSVEELRTLIDSGRACIWDETGLVGGGLTVWAVDQSEGPKVVNLCTAAARRASSTEAGPGPGPGVLAVRGSQP
jgi:hypothetical protein